MCGKFVLPGSDSKLCPVCGAHMAFGIIPVEGWLLTEETGGGQKASEVSQMTRPVTPSLGAAGPSSLVT